MSSQKASIWRSNSFRVGTLTYTRSALLTVMFWMLWADLCLQLMEQLPSIIPLQLKWMGASDALIGFIKDSLQAILTVIFVPVIGVMSDRHRGPMGRRRPFLLWSTIPVCLFLFLLGFADPVARLLHATLSPVFGWLSLPAIGITLIGIAAAGFFFFNNYVIQVYQYLIADVVPKEVMGSFVGLYRAVGALAGFVFNRWIFGSVEGRVGWVYAGCALLYAAGFFLLVWRVKEGEYPPPEAVERLGPVAFVRRYARDCFTNIFYLKIFSASLFYWAATVPMLTFVVFFATSPQSSHATSLGMSLDAFGKVKAWGMVPAFIVFLVSGPIIDRCHPLRVMLVGIIGSVAAYFIGFLWIDTPERYLIWMLVSSGIGALYSLAYLAMFPVLLPREKYGQFFSANQLFFSVGLVGAPFLCGQLLDFVKDYRVLFLWSGVCASISAAFTLSVFHHWKQLGGDAGYVPPMPGDKGGLKRISPAST